MSERDNESFDLDDEFLGGAEDSTDYDRLLRPSGETRAAARANGARRRGASSRKCWPIASSRKISKKLSTTM